MRRLSRLALLVVLIVFTAPACADERAGAVYDPEADAAAQIDAALAEASERGVAALVVFGANWCHDSRGFADRITGGDEALSGFIAEHYALAFIDIGLRHRNLGQAARFGIEAIHGTPTLAVIDGAGALLNADTVHDWRAVYNAGAADLAAYFARFARAPAPIAADASVDVGAAAQAWPAYAAALDGLEALPGPARGQARAYYHGLARSIVHNAMGRVGDAQNQRLAAAADLAALGVSLDDDRTAAVIAHMAEIEFDLEARRQADRADTAEAAAAASP